MHRRRQAGMTLVELLVAMAIGLVVVLAVTTMIVVGRQHERVTTGFNDMTQGGAYAATVIDRALRNAGSGFMQGWNASDGAGVDTNGALGCKLNAKRETTAVLPRASVLPAPFAGFLGGASGQATLGVAPVLIGQGQSASGSDILMVMAGSAGIGGVGREVRANLSGTQIELDNTLGFQPGDVLLVSASTDTASDCAITQVASDFSAFPANATPSKLLGIGGTYVGDTDKLGMVIGAGLAARGSFISGIGKASDLRLDLFGVGTDHVLYRGDLLQTSGADTPEAVSEGVVALRGAYRVDGNISTSSFATTSLSWQAPTGTYAPATLLAESPPEHLRRIVGVRVSLLLRSNSRQPQIAADAEYKLLKDLPGESTVTLSDADRHYAHRVVETTIPLRNALMP
ncbi:PilW family protein [Variovorax arabinosiphilus]|uniref:PilW family protein n=1 Tax=Variovorax arabinosiphilus TaxID=3053498 RepID=UPI002575A63A|nr:MULTISPECIES: PilW family protein [unclassified Variovorax]MDM0121777.1 PilW family protein [Variovorax sp. J2L1-78]MDM0130838.1 PilW family protein [Variovorax sp. J2L1-63]MDM0234540.1 PilW family protein [Variovorax sp. J2R1-6]